MWGARVLNCDDLKGEDFASETEDLGFKIAQALTYIKAF